MTFLRYIFIQLLVYVIDMCVFWGAMSILIFGPILSNILSKIVAGSFALFAHKNFTFGVSEKVKNKKLTFNYFLLLGLNIPLSSIILNFLIFFIEWPMVAKILSDVICLTVNYLLCKFYVFSAHKPDPLFVADKYVEK